MRALEVRSVWAGYGRGDVIRDVTLNVSLGEAYILIGPNGAGKTTTFRVITGVLPPRRGEVMVMGRDVWRDYSARRFIGYLPEGDRVYPDLTVRQNLAFSAKVYGVPEDRINRVMDFMGLRRFEDIRVSALSAGLRKRVALARALLHDPQVLVLDEPFANLDLESVFALRSAVLSMVESGKAVIMSTHVLSEVQYFEGIRARVGVIVDGSIVYESSLSEIIYELGREPVKVVIKALNKEEGLKALEALGYRAECRGSSIYVQVRDLAKEVPLIVSSLAARGVKIYEVRTEETLLEALLRRVTRKR